MNSPKDQLLRQFESTILDEHHKTLSFHSSDTSEAVYTLLAMHDMNAILTTLIPQDALSGVGLTKTHEEGLSQALEWLATDGEVIHIVPSTSAGIFEDAYEYFSHACDYSNIQDMHLLYNRGIVDVYSDIGSRTITFQYKITDDTGVVGYVEAQRRNTQHLKQIESNKKLAVALKLLENNRYIITNNRIVIDDLSVLKIPEVSNAIRELQPQEDDYIDCSIDLGGFDLSHFSRFFHALKCWSVLSELIFIRLARLGHHQASVIPTQVVSRASFIESMEQLAEVPRRAIESIIDLLSFGNNIESNRDVFLQPFFTNDSYISWSVRVVDASRPKRNLMRLLARVKQTANLAATLIGSRDKPFVREVVSFLTSRNPNFLCFTEVAVRHAGEEGEIDIVLFERAYPHILLVVEAKAILAVDEINETASATREMKRAQSQLERVIRILMKYTEHEWRSVLPDIPWQRNKRIYGMVLALEAEPFDDFDHSIFPGVSFGTIKNRVKTKNLRSVEVFYSFCKERRWLRGVKNHRQTFRPLIVGDVTYRIPARVVN